MLLCLPSCRGLNNPGCLGCLTGKFSFVPLGGIYVFGKALSPARGARRAILRARRAHFALIIRGFIGLICLIRLFYVIAATAFLIRGRGGGHCPGGAWLKRRNYWEAV